MITATPSAVVALVLDGRRIYHSSFNILTPVDQDIICSIFIDSPLPDDFRRINSINWNEIVKSRRYNFNFVYRTLRSIIRCNFLFAVKSVLLIVNFLQLLHVLRSENLSRASSACFKRSRLYLLFKPLSVYENMRLLALWRERTADHAIFQFC